jgi:SAM-dependent methyltransferase
VKSREKSANASRIAPFNSPESAMTNTGRRCPATKAQAFTMNRPISTASLLLGILLGGFLGGVWGNGLDRPIAAEAVARGRIYDAPIPIMTSLAAAGGAILGMLIAGITENVLKRERHSEAALTMPAPFKDHFSTRSADYATYRPTYPRRLLAFLKSLTTRHDLALDCGCGAGQLSILLTDGFQRVIATDASPQQIEHAKPHPRVEYRVAPAESSGLPEHSVDLVTVAQAAHWFDLDAFYKEVQRILRPDGAIALITYGVIEADGEVGRILGQFYHEVLGPFWPPERRHVETGYRDLPFSFQELAPPAIAMTAEWTLSETLGYIDTWSAVRQAEAQLGRQPFEQFSTDLTAAWGDPETRREIRWPLSLRAGRIASSDGPHSTPPLA